MKRITDWLKQNKIGASILTGTAVIALIIAGMNGCQITDYVKVNVPIAVQKATNSPSKVTMTDAPGVLEAYYKSGDIFATNIDRGWEWVGFFASMGTTAMEMGKSAIPGGALGLGLLTFASGLMIKGPGTAKGKEASYNKGLEAGQKLAALTFPSRMDS